MLKMLRAVLTTQVGLILADLAPLSFPWALPAFLPSVSGTQGHSHRAEPGPLLGLASWTRAPLEVRVYTLGLLTAQ